MKSVCDSAVYSATAPERATCPPSRTVIRSQVRSTSDIRCDEKTTVIPNSWYVLAHQVEHLVAPGGVEAGRGLVQQHDVRIMDECLGELDPLLHPGRVGAHGAVPRLEEADVPERVRRPHAGPGRGEPADLGHVAQELGGRRLDRQAVVLGHVSEPGAHEGDS